LRVDPRLELAVVGDTGQHRVDVLHEVPRLGVEQHVLLLDAERVGLAAPEPVVENGAHLSTITASASISTRQRGSSKAVTMPVVAGRAVAKTSPCARPTASMSPASVT